MYMKYCIARFNLAVDVPNHHFKTIGGFEFGGSVQDHHVIVVYIIYEL